MILLWLIRIFFFTTMINKMLYQARFLNQSASWAYELCHNLAQQRGPNSEFHREFVGQNVIQSTFLSTLKILEKTSVRGEKPPTKPSNSRTYTCPPHYARCHSATFFLIHPFIKHHQFAVQKKITPSVPNKESEKERKKRIRLHTERIRESSNNNGFIDCTENPSFQLLEGFPSIPPFSSLPFQSLSGLLRFCLQEL